MHRKTLAELARGLAQKEFSSLELTQHFLERIQTHDADLNSFITVLPEQALAQAKTADLLRAKQQAGPLSGVPIAHKDIFCTQGIKTSCGSKMLDNFIAPYNATVIEKSHAAGLVMLGKTNMDEFAMGSSNENSYYGPVKNPHDLSRVPGGSSGGSAAAVAAGLAPAASGTDTGGSIRQPAAFCGITGLKPTYGRVSRWGMIAFASSLDQAGPMTQNAEDAALLMNVLAGFDAKDSTSIARENEDFSAQLNAPLAGKKIGLPRQFFARGIDANIESAVQLALKEFEKLGATLVEIDLPTTDLAIPAYYVIAPAECSSNLARYDGVRFGYRCKNPVDLEDLYKRSRAEGFGHEVKRRILIGTYVLSAGFYDAYYVQAQKIRRLIKDDYQRAFKQVDFIAGPTTPTTAFPLEHETVDPVTMYLNDIYTIAVNLAGLPGLSLPCGIAQGLPVGLQLIGNYFSESSLLNAAHRFQQASDWHTQLLSQSIR
ncbi:MAG TPA: Asp-tRNA(Asn)/Glu-tRNA(Gln) amidotransferase subunit GatA [Pseudomonadales bacterium]|nr:Asp-tRNA(Asn)/Glu-tRNA(Gln) amidotransferase subunit GatA [Pseudomonadales bacterium]